MARKKESNKNEDCLLGAENSTRIDGHDVRIKTVESCVGRMKTGSGTNVLQYVSMLFAVAAAIWGACEWIGKDVTTLDKKHDSEIALIRDEHKNTLNAMEARYITAISELKQLSKERIDGLTESIVIDKERTLSRLQKLEEAATWDFRRRLEKLDKLEQNYYDSQTDAP